MQGDARLVAEVMSELDDAGLHAGLVVRDLYSRREIAVHADDVFPAASAAKVALALAVSEQFESGSLDPALPVAIAPAPLTDPAPTGLSRFRHPAVVAAEDLLSLTMQISDNGAADALLGVVGVDAVRSSLDAAGIDGIVIRHGFRSLADTPLDGSDPAGDHLAHTLAVSGATQDGGHPVALLDLGRATTITAAAAADLLQELWRPTRVSLTVAARVRSLLASNAIRHRLAPEFDSDATRWSSKTGTLMNLRHEIGVVDHDGGAGIVVAALSASTVPARRQPAADLALARAARALYEGVRAG